MNSPNKKLICGFGICDIEKAQTTEQYSKAYERWCNMIYRCYSPTHLRLRPSYSKCNVCDEWKYFSNFYKWFNENYIEGYSLDKDILVKGNKTYSPNTCCFVPLEINNIFAEHNRHKSRFPVGVSYCKERKKYSASLCCFGKQYSLGRFNTLEEALNIRIKYENEYMNRLAEEYKDKINIKVYNRIKNYKREK